jgi:hypothetical protein
MNKIRNFLGLRKQPRNTLKIRGHDSETEVDCPFLTDPLFIDLVDDEEWIVMTVFFDYPYGDIFFSVLMSAERIKVRYNKKRREIILEAEDCGEAVVFKLDSKATFKWVKEKLEWQRIFARAHKAF